MTILPWLTLKAQAIYMLNKFGSESLEAITDTLVYIHDLIDEDKQDVIEVLREQLELAEGVA